MERDLFYLCRYLCEYLDDLFKERDKKNGINTYHAIVCEIIAERYAENKDTIQKDIQEELLLSKAGASDLINSMVACSLITKEKDQIDKRKDVLSLTLEGEEFNKSNAIHAFEIQDEVLSNLTKKESQEIIRLLNKLIEKLKGGKVNGKEN